MVLADLLSYFSFQLVLHDWHNKVHGMSYPVCGMVRIKTKYFMLIGNSSSCSGSSGFSFSLSEWSFTICFVPHITINKIMSVSLNKTFPPFLTNH